MAERTIGCQPGAGREVHAQGARSRRSDRADATHVVRKQDVRVRRTLARMPRHAFTGIDGFTGGWLVLRAKGGGAAGPCRQKA
ncbi:hypothetical protein E1N52_18320 [Paraburkholderia guartelaensis]|uniref:Uncharacterized protein n=1 Tax=Paraburkholderia guartelaensis TaxID=2546446 RepID=A0A4R5LCZ3_9BURK|nr:hypothetical protein [Paraburkholderia guartelaensis]TDG06748.1 hypothetical protein E1N52_18320 [Paraburkholderia guartelaensis]